LGGKFSDAGEEVMVDFPTKSSKTLERNAAFCIVLGK